MSKRIRLRMSDKAVGYETNKLVGAPHGKSHTSDQDFPVDINKKKMVNVDQWKRWIS